MGTVRHVIPAAGQVLDILKHPLGLVAVVYVPNASIILSEIRPLAVFYATGVPPRQYVHCRLHPARH